MMEDRDVPPKWVGFIICFPRGGMDFMTCFPRYGPLFWHICLNMSPVFISIVTD